MAMMRMRDDGDDENEYFYHWYDIVATNDIVLTNDYNGED